MKSHPTHHLSSKNIPLQTSRRLRTLAMIPASLLGILASQASAQSSVHYEIEFVSEWSAASHPVDFPSNAHISAIVGATHTEAINIWSPGGIATNGLEIIAESGSTDEFEAEIMSLIATSDEIDRYRFVGGLSNSPGSRISNQTITSDFPVISLVGMIAPSPDWIIGVHDINLREGGIWTRELTIDLDPYDAGTDSGVTFTSSNADVTPHAPISNLSNVFPFTGTARFGTITFRLMTSAACSRADIALPYDQFDFFDVSAFLAGFASEDPISDINDDGEFNFFDVSDFLTIFTAGCP